MCTNQTLSTKSFPRDALCCSNFARSSANDERSRLAAQLKSFPELKVAAVAGDIFSALEAVKKVKPDVMILDLEMPGGESLVLVHKVMKS
ncbi:MAG: hypothetical protein GY930_19250 [bacterium]|nr:hypothetical protein [bacterium]